MFDAPARAAARTASPRRRDGDVYYASLAGSHIARIDLDDGEATVVDPPTPARARVASGRDSQGRIWVSEWNAGQVGRVRPGRPAPGRNGSCRATSPQAYAVYVDDHDIVWLTDFGANAIVRFDPATETFESFPLPSSAAAVRQLLGRPGEVWGAESATDKLVRITEGSTRTRMYWRIPKRRDRNRIIRRERRAATSSGTTSGWSTATVRPAWRSWPPPAASTFCAHWVDSPNGIGIR